MCIASLVGLRLSRARRLWLNGLPSLKRCGVVSGRVVRVRIVLRGCFLDRGRGFCFRACRAKSRNGETARGKIRCALQEPAAADRCAFEGAVESVFGDWVFALHDSLLRGFRLACDATAC